MRTRLKSVIAVAALIPLVYAFQNFSSVESSQRNLANVVFNTANQPKVFDPNNSINLAIANNPNVGAVDIVFDWNVIEPQKGVFDFSYALDQMNFYQAHNKKFVIVIRYANESSGSADCSKNQRLPEWIRSDSSIEKFCYATGSTLIPNWLNQKFLNHVHNLAKHVAQFVVDNNFASQVLYTRAGLGLGSESFYLNPCDPRTGCAVARANAYNKMVNEWNFNLTTWTQWQKSLMSFYAKQFYFAKVIYPITDLGTADGATQTVEAEVATWAASRGMGVGAQGLHTGFENGNAKIGPLLISIMQAYPETLIQFQPVSALHKPRGNDKERMLQFNPQQMQTYVRQLMASDIALAQRYGGSTIEWYQEDVNDDSLTDLLMSWPQKAVLGLF